MRKTPHLLFFSFLFLILSALVTAESRVLPFVVGGVPAALNELPWQVGILRDPSEPFRTQFCGGTLVNSHWIISAAHCFRRYTDDHQYSTIRSPNELYVLAGVIDLNLAHSDHIRSVSTVYVHPDFGPETYDNDIALLYLDKPLECESCGTVGLVAPNHANSPDSESLVAAPGMTATLSGWGSQSRDQEKPLFTPYLMRLDAPLWNNWACIWDTSYTARQLTRNMLCAGDIQGTGDSCHGDSGGPLVVPNSQGSGEYLLAGVISWGYGCAEPGFPGINTRVARYVDWISDVTGGDVRIRTYADNDVPKAGDRGASYLLGLFSFLLDLISGASRTGLEE